MDLGRLQVTSDGESEARRWTEGGVGGGIATTAGHIRRKHGAGVEAGASMRAVEKGYAGALCACGLIRHGPGDRQRAAAAAVGRWTEEESGRMRVTYDGKHGAGVEGGACTRTGAKKNAGGLCACCLRRHGLYP